jgi:hypothetical protein
MNRDLGGIVRRDGRSCMEPQIDVRAVRAVLAAEQVTHSAFARACKLSRVYVGRILSGGIQPGELAIIRMQRGLVALGLDQEVRHAS